MIMNKNWSIILKITSKLICTKCKWKIVMDHTFTSTLFLEMLRAPAINDWTMCIHWHVENTSNWPSSHGRTMQACGAFRMKNVKAIQIIRHTFLTLLPMWHDFLFEFLIAKSSGILSKNALYNFFATCSCFASFNWISKNFSA